MHLHRPWPLSDSRKMFPGCFVSVLDRRTGCTMKMNNLAAWWSFLYFRDPAGNSVELITPGVWGLPSGW